LERGRDKAADDEEDEADGALDGEEDWENEVETRGRCGCGRYKSEVDVEEEVDTGGVKAEAVDAAAAGAGITRDCFNGFCCPGLAETGVVRGTLGKWVDNSREGEVDGRICGRGLDQLDEAEVPLGK